MRHLRSPVVNRRVDRLLNQAANPHVSRLHYPAYFASQVHITLVDTPMKDRVSHVHLAHTPIVTQQLYAQVALVSRIRVEVLRVLLSVNLPL
jgi:hypothetical protein